jgi:hypothetical protein
MSYCLPLLCSMGLLAGCGGMPSPTQPSPQAPAPPQLVSFEAEAGIGNGHPVERTRASGGYTVHLAPGERRQWTLNARPGAYALSVTYSNDNIGESELVRVAVDGTPIGSFVARDTGDDGDGWEVFVSDRAGVKVLEAGTHTLSVDVAGGDG